METVWRNTEGFIINWGTFHTGQPNGKVASAVGEDDCLVVERIGLYDYHCFDSKQYYCEGVVNLLQ